MRSLNNPSYRFQSEPIRYLLEVRRVFYALSPRNQRKKAPIQQLLSEICAVTPFIRFYDNHTAILSIITFGSIPALLRANWERLFNVIFCPLRTIISIGSNSGEHDLYFIRSLTKNFSYLLIRSWLFVY